jgi:hypothetical protein
MSLALLVSNSQSPPQPRLMSKSLSPTRASGLSRDNLPIGIIHERACSFAHWIDRTGCGRIACGRLPSVYPARRLRTRSMRLALPNGPKMAGFDMLRQVLALGAFGLLVGWSICSSVRPRLFDFPGVCVKYMAWREADGWIC